MPGATTHPIDRFEAFRRLRASALFTGIPDEALDGLLSDTHVTRTVPDATLIARGESPTALHIILRGRFKVAATDARGRPVTLHVLGVPHPIGALALVDGQSRSDEVVSLSSGKLLTIGRDAFSACARANPTLVWRLAEFVARQATSLTERLLDRASLDVEQRLAKHLVQTAHEVSGGQSGSLMPGTCVSLTQRELGEMIDASREGVNRQLVTWARGGLVQLERNRIRLLAPDELRSLY